MKNKHSGDHREEEAIIRQGLYMTVRLGLLSLAWWQSVKATSS